MKLFFRSLGSGEPLIILHGVFGSSDNWLSVGKHFSNRFKVYLLDLRNHGNSPHSDELDYRVMSEDVLALMREEGMDKAHILGHSMGGKVAMTFATQHPDKTNKLVVVDISPKSYEPDHHQIFEGFRSVDVENLTNRAEAERQMQRVIADFGIRQFLLKNLHRDKQGRFTWKLNIRAIEKAEKKIGEGLEKNSMFRGETLFIAAGESTYIQAHDHALIHTFFPKAKIRTIAGAGHWVHADKPLELQEMVSSFLA